MMLGLLLARAGLSVTVLESQPDFDRDFRGDTVHASTLEVLDQIGLADAALALPHAKMRQVTIHTPDETVELVNFARLPSRFNYVAVMPQSDFLEFLCAEAERYPDFSCVRGAAVTELLQDDGRVAGVRYRRGDDAITVTAELTVAADGRFSRLRRLAGLGAVDRSAPMDVCWLRLPRLDGDGYDTGGFFFGDGRMLICLPRSDEWQMGYVFPKGDYGALRAAGIESFRDSLEATAPWLGDRVSALEDFSQVHLLNVKADCLDVWHTDGLLFIGDAAHIMSPVGGIGINIAIADAVETANVLASPAAPVLGTRLPRSSDLAEIQRRRGRIVRIVQQVQSGIQDVMIRRALSGLPFELPLPARLLLRTPWLRRFPMRVFAFGVSRTRLTSRA
jgi:2-polyprenyl-6-methoxyphenol hydroxylase-like FAD-dependent oxidoreductase